MLTSPRPLPVAPLPPCPLLVRSISSRLTRKRKLHPQSSGTRRAEHLPRGVGGRQHAAPLPQDGAAAGGRHPEMHLHHMVSESRRPHFSFLRLELAHNNARNTRTVVGGWGAALARFFAGLDPLWQPARLHPRVVEVSSALSVDQTRRGRRGAKASASPQTCLFPSRV